MIRKAVVVCWLAVLAASAGDASGQEGAPADEKWTSSIGFGLTKTSGNSEVINLALTFQTSVGMVRSKWSTSANLAYARSDGDESAKRGGAKSQYDYFQTERLFYFGKMGVDFDKFADLDLRTSPGAGLGYVVIQDGKTRLSVDGGANAVTDFFSNETRDTRATFSYSDEFSYAISASAALYQLLNVQNNFEDFGDYLLDSEVTLTTKVSDRLSLKASLLDKYDSTPFTAELKKNDLTFITSLAYTL